MRQEQKKQTDRFTCSCLEYNLT